MVAAELGALKPGRAAYRRCGKLFFREEPERLAELAKGEAPCHTCARCGHTAPLLVIRLSREARRSY